MQDDIPGSFDPASDLDPNEIRVLGVLAEKEALTPDNYPMSLNAVMNGCNQLSSRDPVMQLSEDVVHDTLQRLMQRKLVNGIAQAGARVIKYEHRMRIKWTLEQDKVAVLTVLMLRGLQTAGEIRSRTGRLHDLKAVADVDSALQFLHTDRAAEIMLDVNAPNEILNLCGRGVIQLSEVLGMVDGAVPVQPDSPTVRYEVSIEKILRLTDVPETRTAVREFVQSEAANAGR